ncbi:Oligosaccharyltransferase subunit Ribophorin II-domain-containing protein [Multifurca ochricompacta]|uniref:Oligosaccharyltransferase subunit Ribophorin II-domain-containing protein n=1 Tax=Multifurca ochricompacta TaxID=376703 RepID=A0AAD4M526_9AGAM|nr:Oligosaccharyltransferase subunit Ribophorin II-domain-containing protein [Multifurca ochricompacta]
MSLQSLFLVLLGYIAAVHAGQLTLRSPRLTVLGPDGGQLRSEPISLTKRPDPVTLGARDTLKLTFQVTDQTNDTGVQPHQTFLRFFDSTTGEEGIQPVKVVPSGKAKFELSMAKPPSSLPPSGTAPLHVSLLLGSFVHSPAALDLFDLHIPPSAPAPVHPEESLYHLLPELAHTFRSEPKLPPRPISAFFAALSSAHGLSSLDWCWGAVRPGVSRLFSPSVLSFVLSLTLIEGLLLWYWIELRLGHILLYGSGAAVLTVLTGKQALAGIAARRTSSK